MRKIDAGAVPEHWDGGELRQLVLNRFQAETRKLPRQRQRDFNNTVLVNNL